MDKDIQQCQEKYKSQYIIFKRKNKKNSMNLILIKQKYSWFYFEDLKKKKIVGCFNDFDED